MAVSEKDAHVVALEWLKHVITLSSGIVVFSGTLIGVLLDEPNWTVILLILSWVLFLAAILLSLETVAAITSSRINDDDSWTEGTGRRAARGARWCFTCGIACFALFAGVNAVCLL